MPDPEQRIREALRRLPSSSEEARRRAEAAALAAIAPPRARRRRPRWLLAAAGFAAAVVAAGAALAATDRLEVRIGREPAEPPAMASSQAPPSGRVSVPSGGRGLAIVAGGRLWLATRSGLGVQGLAVSTAELSPGARFVAVGIGRALVAMAPDGRRAWSHPVGGTVVAAAWAPNPIAIAYVVRRGARHELRVIEGDGDNDRLVDPDVVPARPSWRADTGALAYAGRGPHVRVVHYPTLTRRRTLSAPGGAAALSFAPSGDRLAVAAGGASGRVGVTAADGGLRWATPAPGNQLTSLAWHGSDALMIAGPELGTHGMARLWVVPVADGPSGKPSATAHGPRIEAMAAPRRGRIVVAVPDGPGLSVWEVAVPTAGADVEMRPRRVLLRLPRWGGGVQEMSAP